MKKIKVYEQINYDETSLLTQYQIEKIYPSFIIVKNNENLYATISLHTKKLGNLEPNFRYKRIGEFKNGLAVFRTIDDKYGLMDEEGRERWSTELDDLWYRDENLYAFQLNNKLGLINQYGHMVLKAQYDNILSFQGEYAIVENNRFYGLINRYGDEVLACNYMQIEIIDNKYFILNNQFLVKLVKIGNNYFKDQILYNKNSNLNYIGHNRLYMKNKSKLSLYDLEGNLIKKFKKKYQIYNLNKTKLDFFEANCISTRLVNFDGDIITPEYINLYYTEDNYVVARNINLEYVLLNSKGERVLDAFYDKINHLGDSIYSVYRYKANSYGYYNAESGKFYYPVKPQFQEIRYADGVFLTKINNNWGMMDLDNKKLLSHEYQTIEYLNDGVFAGFKDNFYYLFNNEGKPLNNHKYTYIDNFSDGHAILTNDKEYVVLNNNGQEIIKDSNLKNSKLEVKLNLIHLSESKYHSLYKLDGQCIFKDLYLNYLYILNEERVIINNYLMDIDNIKINYLIDIYDDSKSNTISFDTREKRDEYLANHNNKVSQDIMKWRKERQELITTFKKESAKQIDKLNDIIGSVDIDFEDIMGTFKEEEIEKIDQIEENDEEKTKLIIKRVIK